MKKNSSRLTTVYYRNFFLLIVIPILLVIVIALGVLRKMMLQSEFDKIDLAQQNVAQTLNSEAQNASLKLTHFIFANNRQALELAETGVQTTGQEHYTATNHLKELYNFLVPPSSDIVAIHFYTANGQVISLKEDPAIPVQEIQQLGFYQTALQHVEQTQIDILANSITFKARQIEPSRKCIAVSFAPQQGPGTNIEAVCLYTNSQAPRMVTSYSRTSSQGEMYVIDTSGNVLIAPDNPVLLYSEGQTAAGLVPGRYTVQQGKEKLYYTITSVPRTNWKIVSIVNNQQLLGNFNTIARVVFAASLVVFMLFMAFSVLFLRNIIQPVNSLIGGMAKVEKGDLDVHLEAVGQSEVRELTHSFNSMIRQTRELVSANEVQQKQKHEAEMEALQSQINPHFLVNSLNSIRFTAMAAKFDSIRNMAESLIKILTASFKAPESPYTVADEIEMLESYIYLMKIRYSENFEVEWEIEETCLKCSVPRLIMQPIVENAIIHGFEEKEEPGNIYIAIFRRQESLTFEISDDGKGIAPERIQTLLNDYTVKPSARQGIGIANVNRRIKLNYGEEYGIAIQSQPGLGSKFIITLPALQQKEGQDA